MRGEMNKRHNRKIRGCCPVCGGRVIVAHHGIDWWVACEENSSHIKQNLYPEPIDAIRAWNGKTNADKIRNMSDEELAYLFASWIQDCGCNNVPCEEPCKKKIEADIFAAAPCEENWLDWLRQEAK